MHIICFALVAQRRSAAFGHARRNSAPPDTACSGDTQIYGLNRDPRLPVPDYHKKPKGWWSNPRKARMHMMFPKLAAAASVSNVLL